MERRRNKRFPVNLSARIICNGNRYEGIIGNISEEGLSYSITTFIQAGKDFVPNGTIEVIFDIPSGEKLHLMCQMRWFLKPKPDGTSVIIGMQIAEPSSKYRDWVKEIEARCNQQAV